MTAVALAVMAALSGGRWTTTMTRPNGAANTRKQLLLPLNGRNLGFSIAGTGEATASIVMGYTQS